LYDIRPGNGAGPFLQPWNPHGALDRGHQRKAWWDCVNYTGCWQRHVGEQFVHGCSSKTLDLSITSLMRNIYTTLPKSTHCTALHTYTVAQNLTTTIHQRQAHLMLTNLR